VERQVASANEHLSGPERIRRFHIVDTAWLPGGDELTPTMKLKRRPIAAKYTDLIEDMYA
jgi:long-chain acyl-CoA synthetase